MGEIGANDGFGPEMSGHVWPSGPNPSFRSQEKRLEMDARNLLQQMMSHRKCCFLTKPWSGSSVARIAQKLVCGTLKECVQATKTREISHRAGGDNQ